MTALNPESPLFGFLSRLSPKKPRVGFELAVRCAYIDVPRFRNGVKVVDVERALAGTEGSYGDAGWAILELGSRTAARWVMSHWPRARMPCWKDI